MALIPKARAWAQTYEKGLDTREIRNDVDYDMAYIEYILEDEPLLKKRFRLAFNDLNERRLFSKHYNEKEIDSYIDATIKAAKHFKSEIKFPILEEWDAHHGIGKPFGFALTEVAFDFTAFVGVEFAFAVTALGLTSRPGGDEINPSHVFLEEKHQRAAVVSQLLKLASDLFVATESYRIRK